MDNFEHNEELKIIGFVESVEGQYVKFEIVGYGIFASASIINLYEDNNCVIVEIKNTFSESIDVDLVGNKGYSTKGKLRGLGIFSALRDNEASLNVKIYNNLFINTITAKKFILE